jgi:AcrR family transcriptional regulator
MGIAERQQRDRDKVRRAILDAARELFVREGFANVTIRRIAERIEYSPGSIYTYFPSKDEILCALALEGYDLLAGRALPAGLEPLAAVRAVLRRIYEFSKEQPEYFALMFFDRSIPRIAREHRHFARLLEHRKKLMSLLARCIESGAFPPGLDPIAAFRVASMGLFGVAALRLAGRLPDPAADRLAADVTEAAIAGLKAGSAVSYRVDLDPAFAAVHSKATPDRAARRSIRARTRRRVA